MKFFTCVGDFTEALKNILDKSNWSLEIHQKNQLKSEAL